VKRWQLGIVAVLASLLWACGGGGGGAGEKVSVHLTVPLGEGGPAVAEVVYQAGDGSWQLAPQTGLGRYAFSLPPGEKRYGVAIACYPYGTALGSVGWVKVYQLTTDEARALKVACFDLELGYLEMTELRVRAHAKSGDLGYDRAWYYTAIDQEQGDFSGSVNLTIEAKPDRDLLVVAYADGTSQWHPDLIRRIRFLRDYDASAAPPLSLDVELGPGDRPASSRVHAFSVPRWADGGSSFGVGFVSAQGLRVPHTSHDPGENPALGAGDAAGGSYLRIPGAGGDDVYYAEAVAWDAGGTHFASQVRILGSSGPEIEFKLPEGRFDPRVDDNALPTFGGLTPSGTNPIAYAFFMGFTGFGMEAVVSPGWLASADRYRFPDLTGVEGFQGSRPRKGEEVHWRATAVMSETPLGEILAGDPLPVPAPVPRAPGLSLQLVSKAGRYTVR